MKVKFKSYWKFFGKKKTYGLAVLKLKFKYKEILSITVLNFGVQFLFRGSK